MKLVSLYLFIKFKFSVACTSVWPPDKNAIPGTILGTFSFKHLSVIFAIDDHSACSKWHSFFK